MFGYPFLVIFLIFVLAYWYGRKTKEWKWSEYFLMALGPIAAVLLLAWHEDSKIIIYFIFSSFIGFTAEFILGLFCHKILGRRLWKYSKFSIFGYTSLLTLPFWGGAGILFLSLARLLNL